MYDNSLSAGEWDPAGEAHSASQTTYLMEKRLANNNNNNNNTFIYIAL